MADNPVTVEARRLWHFGHLPEAIRLAQTWPATDDQTQLFLMRCFLDQGHFQEATAVSIQALSTPSSDSEAGEAIRLRAAFLQIYCAGDSHIIDVAGHDAIARLPTTCGTTALAHDLLGRAIAITVTWNLAPPSDLAIAQTHLTQAIQIYTEVGDTDAALATLLKLGQIYLLGPSPDRTTAQTLFQQAHDQAQSSHHPSRQAEALLRLAELYLDASLARRGGEPDFSIDPTPYQQALSLYETIGHALGPADVLLSLGSRLIKAGFDGTDSVQQALQIYRQQDNLLGICNALTDLTSWYLQQGQIHESLKLRQEALAIAQQMGFPLAQATAYLGIGDYYFRTADYANALAAYEHVETLTDLPGIRAMHGLALANAYTLMNLPDRAETICRQTIALLQPIGNTPSLSLAYFILGNVLSAQGQWVEAISRWQVGLTVDVALQNRFDQAEKLKCIAQATVMQHHRLGGFTVPDAAYETAMAYYAEAIACLEAIGDRQATAAIAGTYQLQGQTAVACGRSLDALHYLEQAHQIYASLELGMQTAMTDSLLGLTCHDLGGRGYPDLYVDASQCYERALAYFQTTEMRDLTWKVCFYLADIDYLQGFRAPTEAEQRSHWQTAARWLQTAATEIDQVRGKFIAADAIARETARLGLVSNKEKVYTFAIKLHQTCLRDNIAAFNWLERLKGRVFLEGLALTSLRTPAIADTDLLYQEQTVLTALQQATTQAEVITYSQHLNHLWDCMAVDRAAAEYVSLRRAEPICLEALLPSLHP